MLNFDFMGFKSYIKMCMFKKQLKLKTGYENEISSMPIFFFLTER